MVMVLVGGSISGRSGICSTFLKVGWPLQHVLCQNKQYNHTKAKDRHSNLSPNDLFAYSVGPISHQTTETNRHFQQLDERD
jgi:hypothetical protein